MGLDLSGARSFWRVLQQISSRFRCVAYQFTCGNRSSPKPNSPPRVKDSAGWECKKGGCIRGVKFAESTRCPQILPRLQESAPETSSPPTPPTAIESASAETFPRYPDLDREKPAVSRRLVVGVFSIRTGDGGIGRQWAMRLTFISVVRFGGSDSSRGIGSRSAAISRASQRGALALSASSRALRCAASSRLKRYTSNAAAACSTIGSEEESIRIPFKASCVWAALGT
jgi:hypothetical protein